MRVPHVQAPRRDRSTRSPRVTKRTGRRTGRRWCIPTAITHDDREMLEGTAILDEFPTPLGVYLWHRARDVTLWASLPAGERVGTFTPQAADRAVLLLLDAAPEDLPASAVEGFDRILRQPGDVSGTDVAGFAESVATWAQRCGAPATALAYTQAAALAAPASPGRALATGQLAAAAGQGGRSETWFRRSVALARRAGAWSIYVRAYLELGALREEEGLVDAAQEMFIRALRGARRAGVREERGAAIHGLMRVALRRGRLEDAERLGRHARRFMDRDTPGLRHDLAELAVRRGEGAAEVPVLRELLGSRTQHAERVATLRLLCRAAAQAGDRATLEDVWPEVQELARAAQPGDDAGSVLLEVARAAASAGAVRRAEAIARAVAQSASTPEESITTTEPRRKPFT